ncbi:MAG: hypothetical protein ABI687_01840 [Flavitalea sp.]
MLVNENNSMPYMKSLSSCLAKVVAEGYKEDFKATDKGLKSLSTQKVYQPDQVSIVNFYRFEGVSDPDDMAILYIIQTSDGLKGTVVDAYGVYSNPEINSFFISVENIKKKVIK